MTEENPFVDSTGKGMKKRTSSSSAQKSFNPFDELIDKDEMADDGSDDDDVPSPSAMAASQ
jgi:hypothetical protein